MRKTGFASFLAIFLSLGFIVTGCYSPTPREQLADTGIFEEHRLKRIESFASVAGSVGGGFFLGIGSVRGSLGSEFKLQFYWEPKSGEIVVSSLPYSKFRFIVDENKEVPTAEFVFDSRWVDNETSYREYRKEEKLNPNSFVMSSRMEVVLVRISSKTLEKEVYLPKAK